MSPNCQGWQAVRGCLCNEAESVYISLSLSPLREASAPDSLPVLAPAESHMPVTRMHSGKPPTQHTAGPIHGGIYYKVEEVE